MPKTLGRHHESQGNLGVSMTILTAEDQAAIGALWIEYGGAVGRRDAAAAAALFSSDGDALAIDGELLRGPKEVEEYYTRKLPGQYANLSITDVSLGEARSIGTDLALVNGTWRVHGLNPEPFPVRSTFIIRRERDGWRYVAVRLMVPFTVSG